MQDFLFAVALDNMVEDDRLLVLARWWRHRPRVCFMWHGDLHGGIAALDWRVLHHQHFPRIRIRYPAGRNARTVPPRAAAIIHSERPTEESEVVSTLLGNFTT